MSSWKKNRKLVEIKCDYCNTLFDKIKTEYDRNEKNNKKHFCSQSCSAKYNRNILKNSNNGNVENFKGRRCIQFRDEYSPFRKFFTRAKRRNKLGDLTLQNIKEQWEMQNGVCPYSGVVLELNTKDRIKQASLDRIDSNIGYEKNNIVFVSTSINYMKSTMSVDETIKLCKLIAKKWCNYG